MADNDEQLVPPPDSPIYTPIVDDPKPWNWQSFVVGILAGATIAVVFARTTAPKGTYRKAW